MCSRYARSLVQKLLPSVVEKDPDPDREGPRDGHSHGQEVVLAFHSWRGDLVPSWIQVSQVPATRWGSSPSSFCGSPGWKGTFVLGIQPGGGVRVPLA